MSRPATPNEGTQARHVDLLVHQLEELPTLSPIAVRVIQLTSDESCQASELIGAISADPALASKVLRLCRCHPRARAMDVSSLDRAVLLMGFDAVRSAVLSITVVDLIGDGTESQACFNLRAFWEHSLAVATLSEQIVERSARPDLPDPGEAFLAGLLHDLGMFTLWRLLPRSFDQVCRYVSENEVSLDQACRKVIGMDTHTAGRRLGQHWKLPVSLTDVMWLKGQHPQALPEVPHRALVLVVSMADALARVHASAPLGHSARPGWTEPVARALRLDSDEVASICAALSETVSERATALGLEATIDHATMLRSLGRANESLGRLNNGLRIRLATEERRGAIADAIASFQTQSIAAESIPGALRCIAQSAAEILDASTLHLLWRHEQKTAWELITLVDHGFPAEMLRPTNLSETSENCADHLTRVRDLLGLERGVELQAIPLPCPGGLRSVLLCEGETLATCADADLKGLISAWATALTAAVRQDDAQVLGEALAKSNRVLAEMQEEMASRRIMASVGEVAAGAAHEMNNPLCIISGRSQLLAQTLDDPDDRATARQISEQAAMLSDMISALRAVAEPVRPARRAIDMHDVVNSAINTCRDRMDNGGAIKVLIAQEVPMIYADPDLLHQAVTELLFNALEAPGSRHVQLRVHIDDLDDRLIIRVRDDGSGLSDLALTHAFDPFVSVKEAGRQRGLGLARARLQVEAHGGRLTLANRSTGGAEATISLESWRLETIERDAA